MIGLSRRRILRRGIRRERPDCGSKAGFLRANIAFGMPAPPGDGLRADMESIRE